MLPLSGGIVFAVLKKTFRSHQIYIQKIIPGQEDAIQESPTFILLIIDSDNLNDYEYKQTITDHYKSTE